MAPGKRKRAQTGSKGPKNSAAAPEEQGSVDWSRIIRTGTVVKRCDLPGLPEVEASRLEVWTQHRDNPLVCSIHLVADKDNDPEGKVPISAQLLLEQSGFFRALLRHEQDMAPLGMATAVGLPHPLPLPVLEALVRAIHGASLKISPTTVEPLLRAMSAMEMMPLLEALATYLAGKVLDADWGVMTALAQLMVELGLPAVLRTTLLPRILQRCMTDVREQECVAATVFEQVDQACADCAVRSFWLGAAGPHTPLLVLAALQPVLLLVVRWDWVPPVEARAVFRALPQGCAALQALPAKWVARMAQHDDEPLAVECSPYYAVNMALAQVAGGPDVADTELDGAGTLYGCGKGL